MTQKPPRIRHKTFTYPNDLQWLGHRAGRLTAPGKPDLRLASPPEFKGEEGVWTPEDLFVAAINACTMTTFAAFAAHRKLDVTSYTCRAEGTLEFTDGGYRFTRVCLAPVIGVGDASQVALARQVIADAHASCLVSNSVRAEVQLEATVQVEQAAHETPRGTTAP